MNANFLSASCIDPVFPQLADHHLRPYETYARAVFRKALWTPLFSIKLIRWAAAQLSLAVPWKLACAALAALYASL